MYGVLRPCAKKRNRPVGAVSVLTYKACGEHAITSTQRFLVEALRRHELVPRCISADGASPLNGAAIVLRRQRDGLAAHGRVAANGSGVKDAENAVVTNRDRRHEL